jgi:hypothetical protein
MQNGDSFEPIEEVKAETVLLNGLWDMPLLVILLKKKFQSFNSRIIMPQNRLGRKN